MFQKKKRKRKKQSSVLFVDATNKSPERAISEFKRKVKNSNLLKELRDKEVFFFSIYLYVTSILCVCTESNKINP